MKRILTALLFIAIVGASSCAYRTCPTYAKKDIKKIEIKERVSEDQNM